MRSMNRLDAVREFLVERGTSARSYPCRHAHAHIPFPRELGERF
jgi:hypothetical protein